MTFRGLHGYWKVILILCAFVGLENIMLFEILGQLTNLVMAAFWTAAVGCIMQIKYFRPRPQFSIYINSFETHPPELERWKEAV